MAQHRMLPVKRLVRRLELTEYMHKAPMTDEIYAPQQVIIPLRQHIGAPAVPVVSEGDNVTAGMLIAAVRKKHWVRRFTPVSAVWFAILTARLSR